ncbi:MAG TPA: class I SAM-dependent methyltransferase, partial [Spongiibacteraceae bacterium]|nr:class I SAM-dependent methyltransferase [Spongiibacteraceae bacterium]
LGRVDILHARKKARLFKISPRPGLAAALSTPLIAPTLKYLEIAEYALQLGGGANVFARDKLDIGARFFIEQFAKLPAAQNIADLGCGNGILGIMAKRLQPAAAISFIDESYQAVEAAADNYRRNIDAALAPPATFHFDDGLSHYSGKPFDLILCNPPFHQNHATGDQVAWRMFTQSKNHLGPGGELWIVGNRHLDYALKLKRVFGNCRQIAAHPKFVVLAAKK